MLLLLDNLGIFQGDEDDFDDFKTSERSKDRRRARSPPVPALPPSLPSRNRIRCGAHTEIDAGRARFHKLLISKKKNAVERREKLSSFVSPPSLCLSLSFSQLSRLAIYFSFFPPADIKKEELGYRKLKQNYSNRTHVASSRPSPPLAQRYCYVQAISPGDDYSTTFPTTLYLFSKKVNQLWRVPSSFSLREE